MVPFMRLLEGDKTVQVHDFERDAGIVALYAAGVPTWRICKAFNMSAAVVNDILAGKEPKRREGPMAASEKYDRWKAGQARRYAQRVMVGGRLVHPNAVHGSNASYTGYGCRCVPCSESHTVARRRSYVKKEVAA